MQQPNENTAILIADDAALVRKLAEMMLGADNYSVCTCANGREAVEYAAKQLFSIIFLDVQMPVLDGFAALDMIRTVTQNSRTCVIAMTAASSPDERLKCIEQGFDDYLCKPFTPEQILRKVRNRLAGPKALQSALCGEPVVSLLTDCREYRSTIETFVQSVRGIADEIDKAFANKDFEEIIRHAHTLKGTGSMAGFPAYSELALHIENALASGSTQSLAEQIKILKELVAATRP